MNLDSLIPSETLNPAEQETLVLLMQNPLIRKYLRVLATEDAKELLGLPALGKSDGELVKAHATIQGRLQTLATLQSIGDIPETKKES